MNGTNQNQSLGKSELRYYFIRLTMWDILGSKNNLYRLWSNAHNHVYIVNARSESIDILEVSYLFRPYIGTQLYHENVRIVKYCFKPVLTHVQGVL